MKKILFALLLGAILFSPNLYADEEDYYFGVRQESKDAVLTWPLQERLQLMMDYDGRTDGQPVFLGYSTQGTATSNTDSPGWIVYKFTYDGSDQMTSRQTSFGAYDDRASLTYS